MVTEGNACGAIPWILLGLPMVDTARFQGLHYNHGPTGHAFGSFAAIMCRTVTMVTGTTARVAPTRFGGSPRRERRPRPSLRNKACRDTRPRVSPTFGRVDPDTPGGVSGQRSP